MGSDWQPAGPPASPHRETCPHTPTVTHGHRAEQTGVSARETGMGHKQRVLKQLHADLNLTAALTAT